MRHLGKRIEALEVADAQLVPVRWHLVGCPGDISCEEGVSAYEAEHGPIGDDDKVIFLVALSAAER